MVPNHRGTETGGTGDYETGGRYVRLKASAPSIPCRADIETVISPIVGNEKQSEEMINYLLQEFEGDPKQIRQSNIFGKSFHELVNEDLQGKLMRMPEDAGVKLRETLQRIINEGSGGLICLFVKVNGAAHSVVRHHLFYVNLIS